MKHVLNVHQPTNNHQTVRVLSVLYRWYVEETMLFWSVLRIWFEMWGEKYAKNKSEQHRFAYVSSAGVSVCMCGCVSLKITQVRIAINQHIQLVFSIAMAEFDKIISNTQTSIDWHGRMSGFVRSHSRMPCSKSEQVAFGACEIYYTGTKSRHRNDTINSFVEQPKKTNFLHEIFKFIGKNYHAHSCAIIIIQYFWCLFGVLSDTTIIASTARTHIRYVACLNFMHSKHAIEVRKYSE